MGKNPDVIEATHMVLHLMKAGMAIYGYPAAAITSEFLRAWVSVFDVKGMARVLCTISSFAKTKNRDWKPRDGTMPENTVRIESSARVRARHALFAHDVADAPPGRGDASPFQGGLDLPGAVAFAAVEPDRAHVAGDRIHMLRLGMPGHPVVGGAGNVRYPTLR